MVDRDSQLEPDPAPPEHDALARGHEGTAVSVRWIVYTMSTLTVICVLTLVVCWSIMKTFERWSSKRDPQPSPLASQKQPPPEPWLQPSPPQGEPRQPWQDTESYRRREEERLNSYQVVDAKRGVVQIPVERAMQILAAPSTRATTRPATSRPNREATGGHP
ncbi:MAG: hypothetical protein H7Z14_06755 [Anaerolineae bacterium]|nr:hypothetical protein [Phycisphaerae bacterium]